MSNPLYSVGQDVGVCNRDLTIVIPATKIIQVDYFEERISQRIASNEWRWFPASWVYRVAAMPDSPDGAEAWFSEICLRPILPGDYTEDTQDLQSPIESGVGV